MNVRTEIYQHEFPPQKKPNKKKNKPGADPVCMFFFSFSYFNRAEQQLNVMWKPINNFDTNHKSQIRSGSEIW